MKIENGTIYINHLIGEAFANYAGKLAFHLSDVEETEDHAIYLVNEYGADTALKYLKAFLDRSNRFAIGENVKAKYNITTDDDVVSEWRICNGADDLVELKNSFHDAMRIAEVAGAVDQQLDIIQRHSLFGRAYVTAAREYDEFWYPQAADVFYEFGRILAHLVAMGATIPDEYKKYVVWKKKH